MKTLFKVFIIVIFFIHISCEKEVTAPNFGNWPLKISNHLLQGYFVTSVCFDSEGTAWIGTFKQGLIKYDNNATFYNSTNSILHDGIVMWDVTVDNYDNIWIGSNVGLIKYDKKEFTIYNTSNSAIPEDAVWSVAVDQYNIIWFSSCIFRQGGLMKFDGKNWTLYTPENSQLPYNLIRDIIVDNKNTKWIAISETVTNGCIIKISDDNWVMFNESEIGFSPYYFGNLAVDYEDNLFASIDYNLSSLRDMTRPNIIKYNGNTWSINNPVDKNGESLGYVRKINVDYLGNIWAALYGSGYMLAVFNGEKWVYNDSDFPTCSIYEIAFDKTNRIWLGTTDGIYLIKQ